MENQKSAPFYEALQDYVQKKITPFHTPGHRGAKSLGNEWRLSEKLLSLDITEISGLDWEQSLEAAQRLAAEFYQADRSFFLVQGATQGIVAALLGCFSPDERILVARNCHISVINGIILAGLNPVFIDLDWVLEWEIPVGLKLGSLRKAVEQYPDFKGLVVTNPTYQGIACSLKGYREIIGDRLLIVDEAHGGHFDWCGLTGFNAFEDADLWVQGTHKLCGSLTQTGMLHLNLKRLNHRRLSESLSLITTTSQSFILLASLDVNRCFLANEGRRFFREKLPLIETVKGNLAQLKGIKLLSEEVISRDKVIDPWKISISFLNLGLTGYEADRILRQDYQIQPEYADLHQVTFFIAPWQEEADLEKLERAIGNIANTYQCFESSNIQNKFNISYSAPPLIIKPHDAVFGTTRYIRLEEAVGRVAAGVLAPYPPGIPLIVPGEVIGTGEVNYIDKILNHGGTVRGMNPRREILICCNEGMDEKGIFY